ncbi:MAG: hypothetical protein ACFFBD_03645 [Candidatus Hodarchaeota archaeon]
MDIRNKPFKEIIFCLVIFFGFYIVHYLLTQHMADLTTLCFLFIGAILTRVCLYLLKRRLKALELKNFNETVIVSKKPVFMKVFSCPLPENFSKIPLAVLLAPLSIELLPLKNELRFFFYSYDMAELRFRCNLARKKLFRCISSIKTILPSHLKNILIEAKTLSIKKQKFLEQGSNLFAYYSPSSDEGVEAIKDYCNRYIQKYANTGEIRIVLPFITDESLIKTKPDSNLSSISNWSSSQAKTLNCFRGIEVYTSIVEYSDPLTLGKDLDRAYESIKANNLQGFNQESDSSLALRAKIRFPSRCSEELPINLGFQYFLELSEIVNCKKRVYSDKPQNDNSVSNLQMLAPQDARSVSNLAQKKEKIDINILPSSLEQNMPLIDTNFAKNPPQNSLSNPLLPKLHISYFHQSDICKDCPTSASPAKCLENLKNAFKAIYYSEDFLSNQNILNGDYKTLSDAVKQISIEKGLVMDCLLVLLSTDSNYDKLKPYFQLMASSKNKNIDKSNTKLITDSHDESVFLETLHGFCDYCPFQYDSTECHGYRSQIQPKFNSMVKSTDIKLGEITTDTLPIFISLLDPKWQKDACMLRTILITLLNSKEKKQGITNTEKEKIIAATLELFEKIHYYDLEPPLALRN